MRHTKLTALLLACLLIAGLAAAPLTNTPVRVTQPDGRSLEIYASGDEFHNWLHDADQFTIVQDDAGYYVYARSEGEGVAPTELVVGRDDPRLRGLQPGINLSSRLIAQK
ncbi:MAG TPA: hypothetical protein PKH19_06020, partial [Candidatus Syntrophosphaera sp.]|nr:hypothetical protein [Candidatus Syntrophosphaera sp.]